MPHSPIPHSMTGEINFLQTFQRRHEFCKALLELSQIQKKCIEQNNTTELLEILNHKQRILKEFEKLREQQPQLGEQWKQIRDSFPEEIRSACDEYLLSAEQLLKRLQELEQECIHQLTHNKQNLQGQLQKVTAGALAHNSYHEVNKTTRPQHLDINQ